MLNHLGMAYGVQRMPESISCFEQALAISVHLATNKAWRGQPPMHRKHTLTCAVSKMHCRPPIVRLPFSASRVIAISRAARSAFWAGRAASWTGSRRPSIIWSRR